MFTKECLKSKVVNFDFDLRKDRVVCYTKDEFIKVLRYRIRLIESELTSVIAPNRVYIYFTFSNDADKDNTYLYSFRTHRMDYLDMLVVLFKGIETRGFDIEIQKIEIHEAM